VVSQNSKSFTWDKNILLAIQPSLVDYNESETNMNLRLRHNLMQGLTEIQQSHS